MKKFCLLFFPLVSLFCTEGIDYRCFEYPADSYLRSVVHVIEIDPTLYDIKLVKALDDGLGRESVLSLSKRYQAIAAINGGFFSIGGIYDGRACGALKINRWVALPFKPRGCIGWLKEDQIPKMDRLIVKITIQTDYGQMPVDGLNRPRQEGEMILFNPSFKTTLTDQSGEEIVVVKGIITSIGEEGNSQIPENGFILSIHHNHPFYKTLKLGQSVELITDVQSFLGNMRGEEWDSLDYILGGTPLLIYDSDKVGDFEFEKTRWMFLWGKHARTAVGVLPNGHWLFVTVDRTGLFDGMTIFQLTDLMESLGCSYALNLDGGGSSTMLYEGELKNNPRGDEEEDEGLSKVRRVSDALVVLSKDPS